MSWVISGIWEGFSDALGSAVNSILSSLGAALENAIRWAVNTTLSGIENFLNWFRNFIPYALMILISWYGISSIVMKPDLSLWKKFIGVLGSVGLGVLSSQLLDALIPKQVELPRWIRYAPEHLVEEYYHPLFTEEGVVIAEAVAPFEEKYHPLYTDEYVALMEMITPSEEYYHTQYTYEEVTLE